MKITTKHYEYMKAAILEIADKLPAHREALKHDVRVKDIERRLRWDAFYAAIFGPDDARQKLSVWAFDNLGSDINDNHIDTALRSIMKEITYEQSSTSPGPVGGRQAEKLQQS